MQENAQKKFTKILKYIDQMLRQRRCGYAVCTAPRSGSNLLCQYLTSTGVLGRPLEYFNATARRALNDPDYPDDVTLQLNKILTTGSTPNGVYGLKLFAYQHAVVVGSLEWHSLLPDLKFIYLKRRNLLGQAISWARAVQTSQYRSTQKALAAPIYDSDLIQERLNTLEWEYQQWTKFFESQEISPLEIVYEDFVTDPQHSVDQVAALIGMRCDPQISYDCVDLNIQRDATTEEWAHRFRCDRLEKQ